MISVSDPVEEKKASPMMLQWQDCKKSAPDAVLLFRMGDFYEAFYEDAALLAKELDLVLTKRQGIPMSGVPHHTCEAYIDKLIGKGYRVAIAEQMEDPRKAKGIVKREVVRILSPGTIVNSSLLREKSNNFFVATAQVNTLYGLAYADVTTGEFFVAEFDNLGDLVNEIHRLQPAEWLFSEKFQSKHSPFLEEIHRNYRTLLSVCEDWRFDHQFSYNFLVSHFRVHGLEGFGVKGMVTAINAAGALLSHLKDTLCQSVTAIEKIGVYSTKQFMILDHMTQRNLELTESLHDSSRNHTLLHLLDKTKTAMGGRCLRQWIKQPLINVQEIKERQGALEALFPNLERLVDLLSQIRDLERILTKLSSGYCSPRDLVALSSSFQPLPEIKAILAQSSSPLLQKISQKMSDFPQIMQLIASALVEEPPARIHDGNVFREGYCPELDELRELSRDSKNWISLYQNQLREQTGIKTLKVGFNRMFGYYIEVSRSQAEKMPATFQRKQTLVNGERFITPELKNYEIKVLTAEERIQSIEEELFSLLREQILPYSQEILKTSQQIAQLDCLYSLAQVAKERNYTKPSVDDTHDLQIVDGRHPVIEGLNFGEKFVANDTLLDNQNQRMMILTGPNMAGKSTYIRQVALLVIMSQIGSFIPASSARLGWVDKVFTRIGASDDLARGQSTFMVEMTETANILHNATDRSLVILDEIGRGTSTYDGISIAWAVAEFLLTAEEKKAKTLFATHYWELTKLEEKMAGAVNYNVAVQEYEDQIIFLRKIIKGGTDKSYGIHVARLAGLPSWVVTRAQEILVHLEQNANRSSAFEPEKPKRLPSKLKKTNESQLLLFTKEF